MASNFGPLPAASTLLGQAWQIVKAKARVVYPLVLLSYVPAVALFLWDQYVDPFLKTNPDNSSTILIIALVGMIVIFVYSIWIAVTLYCAVIFEVSIGRAFETALPKLRGYFWISVVSGMIVAIGIILFVIPGIIFGVWYTFAIVVFLVEGISGMAALKQSKHYVSGRWGSVAGRLIFAGFIYIIVYIPATFLPPFEKFIYTAIWGIFFAPIFIAYHYSLYYALRQSMPVQTYETPAQTV